MPAVSPIPFSDFQSLLLNLYRPPLRAQSTYYAMDKVLRDFAAVPGVVSTADFTTNAVALYIASRGADNVNTTISRLRALKTASLYAVAEGWLERPPQWSRLFPREAPPVRRMHYDHGDVVRLLERLRAGAIDWRSHRCYAIAATVAYTGLRKNEALYLQLGDIRLDQGVVHVSARRRLKTRASAAPVPLAPELAAILDRWLPEAGPLWLFPGVTRLGPWVGGAPGYRPLDWLRRAGAEVGLPTVSWHGLRHTLGKLLVHRFGNTADQARSVLRHSDLRTTEEFYLHRDDLECLRSIGRTISYKPDDRAA